MSEVIILLILLLCYSKLVDFITECGFRCVGRSYDGAQTFEVSVHLFTFTDIGVKVIGCH